VPPPPPDVHVDPIPWKTGNVGIVPALDVAASGKLVRRQG